jgi:hypothetical protein
MTFKGNNSGGAAKVTGDHRQLEGKIMRKVYERNRAS